MHDLFVNAKVISTRNGVRECTSKHTHRKHHYERKLILPTLPSQ